MTDHVAKARAELAKVRENGEGGVDVFSGALAGTARAFAAASNAHREAEMAVGDEREVGYERADLALSYAQEAAAIIAGVQV